jgi:hypothetical protein
VCADIFYLKSGEKRQALSPEPQCDEQCRRSAILIPLRMMMIQGGNQRQQ